jgi:hypothetical protein
MEVIVALIALISLICFFVMASNISGIKALLENPKETTKSKYWFAEFDKHYHWHNSDAALRALQEAIWLKLTNEGLTKPERKKTYNNLKEQYEPTIIELKGEFLKYPDLVDNTTSQNHLPIDIAGWKR